MLLLALLPALLLPAGLPLALSCGPLLGPFLPGLGVDITRIAHFNVSKQTNFVIYSVALGLRTVFKILTHLLRKTGHIKLIKHLLAVMFLCL